MVLRITFILLHSERVEKNSGAYFYMCLVSMRNFYFPYWNDILCAFFLFHKYDIYFIFLLLENVYGIFTLMCSIRGLLWHLYQSKSISDIPREIGFQCASYVSFIIHFMIEYQTQFYLNFACIIFCFSCSWCWSQSRCLPMCFWLLHNFLVFFSLLFVSQHDRWHFTTRCCARLHLLILSSSPHQNDNNLHSIF